MRASNWGSQDRRSNDVSQILIGAILVVMATKLETKSAITRFVYYKMQ